MLEDHDAMRREIDGPPGAIFIEQTAGAPLGQRLPPWRATGSVRVGDFPGSVRLYNLLPGRASTRNRS